MQLIKDSEKLKIVISEFNNDTDALLMFGRRTELDSIDNLYVIINEGDLLGFIEVAPNQYANAVTIEAIYIRKEHQKKGYATQTIKIVMEKYIKLGYNIFRAEVLSDNKYSIKMFEGLGFKETGKYSTYRYGKLNDTRIYYDLILNK